MARLIGSLEATLINFMVGIVFLIVIVVAFGSGNWAAIRQATLIQFVGGLLGLAVVLLTILAIPKLGAKRTFTLIVTAQLIWSVVVDQIGFMGVPRSIANWKTFLGIAFVIAGAAMVEWSQRGGGARVSAE